MKKVLVSLFLCAAVGTVHAQYSAPMQVRSTISTPYGNVPYTYYVPGIPMHYGNPQISYKHPFTIVLKNDSVISDNVRINITEKQHTIEVKVNRVKATYKPEHTKEIYRILPDGRKLAGIPADTCWLFKANSGKINSYSFIAEEDMYHVIAIQKGEGPIVKLDQKNLTDMVNKDPKVLKLIERKKFAKAITLSNKLP